MIFYIVLYLAFLPREIKALSLAKTLHFLKKICNCATVTNCEIYETIAVL